MAVYAVPSDILIRNFAVLARDGASSRSLLIQSKSRHETEILVSRPMIGSSFSIEELENSFDDALTSFIVSDGKPLKLKVIFNAPESYECIQGQL
jgi:hypothetical protein